MIVMSGIALFCVGLLSGAVNSIAGGGGLIQLPLLLLIVSIPGSGLVSDPNSALQSYFGANKLASFAGALMAIREYGRSIAMPKTMIIGACFGSTLGGLLGTHTLLLMSNQILQPIVLLLMLFALGIVIYQRRFGEHHHQHLTGYREVLAGIALGSLLGFYDGFFGPGTGSFLIVCFVMLFGYELLLATACAKAVNVCSNGASVLMFSITDSVPWHIVLYAALPLAIGNVIGAVIGSRLALRGGNIFIRHMLIVMILSALFLLTWRWYGTDISRWLGGSHFFSSFFTTV